MSSVSANVSILQILYCALLTMATLSVTGNDHYTPLFTSHGLTKMIPSRSVCFLVSPQCRSFRCRRELFGFPGTRANGRDPSSIRGLGTATDRSVQMKITDSAVSNKRVLHTPAFERHYLDHVTKPLCPVSFRNLLPDIDTFIFDADGVLWLGDNVIHGAPRVLEFLIKNKKRVIILTNNATKSRSVYAKKLAKLGFSHSLDKNSIVNPAAVVADTLSRAGLAGHKKVYLIGAQGIRDEMDDLGIEYFGYGPEHHDKTDGSAFLFNIRFEEEPSNVGAVVVGYDKHFNYHKLMKAANYLQQRHCLFLATNEDETCPGPDPRIITPDAGPLVAAVRCASGREPITVGKPNTPSFEFIRVRWSIDPGRTLMVGDRTNTDVKFGRDHGLKTLLVLSGCHQLDDVMENRINERFDMVPDYYATCLGSLMVPNAEHI